MPSLSETIPLRKAKIAKKSIGITFLVFFACLVIMMGILSSQYPSIDDLPKLSDALKHPLPLIWLLLSLLFVCSSPAYQYLYFKRYFYDMDDDNLVIRKGVIAQKEITLPFSRITDVYLDRDGLDVLFGLYDVHVSTPTEESGQFAHIDGISKAGSVQLRQMILDRINPKT